MGDIDRLMMDLSREDAPRTPAHPLPATFPQPDAEIQTPENREAFPAATTKAPGFIILAIIVIMSWLPLILPPVFM
jgi:hypothetical protein